MGGFVLLLAFCLISDGLRFSLRAAETNEQQFIQVLQSNATPREKDAACVQLKRIGTARSVPALASLLTDEQLSHSARYALEAMSNPAAGRSLIAALDKTSGLTKAGIIESLAQRRETKGVPALVKAMKDPDATVATTAAAALGAIGNPEAVTALQAGLESSAGAVHREVVDALLECANRWLAAGAPEKAMALFKQLFNTQKETAIRVAAFRGVLLASGKDGLGLAARTIQGSAGKPRPVQTAALQLVHDLNVPGATEAFAQVLPPVPASTQVALIEGLSQRGDPAAAAAIAPLTRSAAPEVRLAALNALARLGDGTVVPLLAEAASSSTGAEQAAAREALVQVRSGQPGQALLRELAKGTPAVQAEIARALGARSEVAAVPRLLDLAQQGSDSTRQAAVLALAQLVDQPQLASLVQLVVEAKSEAARAQAAEALNSACQHIQLRRGRVDLASVVKAIASGPAEATIALLPVCAGYSDPEVRQALRAKLGDSEPKIRDAAIRALCDTSDPELVPDLVKLACAAPGETLRTLAVGGCVRLASPEEGAKLPDSQRLEMFRSILAAAPNLEQKRLVLSGLGQVHNPAALALAEPMLDDSAVRDEAARALINIASALPRAPQAAAALNKVLAVVPEGPTRQAAESALLQSAPAGSAKGGEGYILAWRVAGPYLEAGKNYRALFDTVFPPEQSDAQGVKWQALPSDAGSDQPWVMDLGKALGGEECVAYARAAVRSDRDQAARLEIGSDDGVKVWLNQKLVHAHNVARAVRPGADKVRVALQAGTNELLLKITQHNQGWAFCARLVQPNGAPLAGLLLEGAPQGLPVRAVESNQPAPAPKPIPAPLGAPDPQFKKVQLSEQFWSEGATFGDFNRDGTMDIASGPSWYEGPDFKKRHEIWPATPSFKRPSSGGTEETVPGFEGALGTKNTYSECFLAFTYDFNQDGWPDLLVVGFPGKAAYWYENPKGAEGPWPRHTVFDEVGNESPGFADVTGDGKPELLCCARSCLGYAEADWNNPAAPWTFHAISPKGNYQKFTHGLGTGDINGDGRVDIIEKDGWWEQPASRTGDPVWTKHPFHFADAGAQMLVYDVNGDGLNDVITSLNCHGYGLAWYEQVRTNGDITFRQHLILNPDAAPNRYGVSFTQPHSLALADMDGDGLMDIVTGKRFWAHGKNGKDPESDGYPAVLYWFQLKRLANGRVDFIPHLIDGDSGVGTQVIAAPIQNPRLPDVLVGNKKGTFLFLNQRTLAHPAEHARAQANP